MIRYVLAFVEYVGAFVLAFITVLTFASVLLRYLFGLPIPDTFDFSRLLMGTVILWGLASASFHDEHIRFELLAEVSGPKFRSILIFVSTVITLAGVVVLTYVLGERIYESYRSQGTTSGLAVPLWPFHLAAWIGTIFASLLLAARIVRALRRNGYDTRRGTSGRDEIL